MSDRLVRYIITADSSGAIRGMKLVEDQSNKTASNLSKAGAKIKGFGGSMASFGGTLSRLSLPIAAVGAYSVKSAMDFQTSMTLLRTQAGASAAEVSKMGAAVQKLSPHVTADPEELAKALYPIESVGLRGSAALQALAASAKGAEVSGDGMVETAEAMSGAMRTNMKDVRSAAGAMAIMHTIVGLGKMKLQDLTEAMKSGILPAAKSVGLGFRDVGSAIDAMTRQGIPADVEATRLRTNLTKMVAPTGAALKALQAIGLKQFSLADDMRKPNGLVTALKDLHEHLQRVGTNEQNLVVAKAFGGAKGSANIIGLLNALPEMEKIQGQLNKQGAGQLNQAFGVTQATTAAKMKEALNGLKVAMIQLGQVLIPVVIPALTKLAKLVQAGAEWFKKLPKPVRDAMVYFGMFLVVAGPLLIFFGNLLKAGGIVMMMFGKLGPSAAAAATEIGGETSAFAAAGTLLGGALSVAMGAAIGVGLLLALNKYKGVIDRYLAKEIGGPFKSGANPVNVSGLDRQLSRKVLAAERKRDGYGVLAPAAERRPTGMQQHIEQQLSTQIATKIEQRQESKTPTKIELHLDGRIVAEQLVGRIRDNRQLARPVAEAVSKYSKQKNQ